MDLQERIGIMEMNNIYLLTNRDEQTITRLLDIWESAVKNTHAFLSDCDIAQIKPEVWQALQSVKLLYGYCDDEGILQGFIGIADNKIEMLFIDGNARGQGIGKRLLNYTVNNLGAMFVDVNEQNELGVAFYKHLGFHVIGRSEYDEQGRPYPLLHLELNLPFYPHKA
ncbi:MAG: GNAT family N-acetyltransferase [Deltaproteobacteria bacterium]|jgi:putative acetyltransferase|nr:GNAT family N-acetyltransferase [Deltaproteobacteria bacterium]